jgi:hypothetical protein
MKRKPLGSIESFRRPAEVALFVALVFVVLAVCVVAAFGPSTQSTDRQLPAPAGPLPAVPSGTTTGGLRYGSYSLGGIKTHVDLVAALGDHGVTGFVREDDLNAGPTTLHQVRAAEMAGTLPGRRTIPLYARDGRTVVDTFTMH